MCGRLGDLSRTVRLVADNRSAGPTLIVDAGSLLYSKSPVPPHLDAQEELKADLLATTYRTDLGVSAIGLGPADLPKKPGKVQLPRSIANLSGSDIPVVAPTLLESAELTGGAKVGVFGVAMPEMVPGASKPEVAGKAAVAELRKKGAQIVIGLLQAPSKKDAVQLMRIGGIDIAIAGLGAAAPEPDRIENEPQKVGDGWLVIPANRGQVVPKLEVTVRGTGPLVDAIGSAAAGAKIASLDKRITAIDADLAKFATDPAADPKFVATLKTERETLATTRDQLKLHPLAAPASGNYFTLAQIRINKTLACAKAVDDRVTAFYRAAGEANVKAVTSKPPAPPKGQPHYAGNATCEDCHADAAKFWKTTVHAKAWQTLVERGQQSIRKPAEDLCVSCHTKEHSDTFQHDAYLRDIVGPGHGEALRKRLGDGPTGAQLRKAALDKAGRTVGAGCSR